MQAEVVSFSQLEVLKDSIQQHLAMIRLLQRGTEDKQPIEKTVFQFLMLKPRMDESGSFSAPRILV